MARKSPVRQRPTGSPFDRPRDQSASSAHVGAPRVTKWQPELWPLIALLVAVPLLVLPLCREAFRDPKLMVAEWFAWLSLLALAPRLAKTLVAGASWLRRPAVLASAPLLALGGLSMVVSPHPLQTRQALIDLAVGVTCLVAWSLVLGRGELERIWSWIYVPATLLVLLGVTQALGLFQPFALAERHLGNRLEITSLAGNPGDLGSFLVLPCLWAQALIACQLGVSRRADEPDSVRRWPKLPRWLPWVATLVTGLGVIVSQTLVALVALTVGSLILWWLVSARRRFLLAGAGAVAVVLGLAVLLVAPLRDRVQSKQRQITRGDWNAVLTGRLDGWRAAVHMVGEHPMLGVGLGGFGAEYPPAKLSLTAAGVEFYRLHVRFGFDRAHNEFLETAAELGWPGLLAVCVGIALLGLAARRLWRVDRPRGSLAWAGLIAVLVLASGHFPMRVAMVAYPILIFLAWMMAEDVPPSQVGGGRPVAGSRKTQLLTLILAAAALAGLLAQSSRGRGRIEAGRIVREVEIFTRQAVLRGEAPRGLFERNLHQLERVAPMAPADVSIKLNIGTQYMLWGRFEAAVAAYRAALVIEPRAEIYLNLGRALVLAGRRNEADSALTTAVTLNPHLAGDAMAVHASRPASSTP